ncbi:fructosamine kinase family protein [Nonomuraea zeae]|uniref:Fructosamine kinase family protein n=1 Tax=Nonomuraea zeae TaxID=1642303 RepID=A0A5S4F4A1_9ACTN|nr:fructosamine kinase family protein [Nonomuraea zeae]TMR10672.1 fructosamine kinase family protein [Nonomuraea zeae]
MELLVRRLREAGFPARSVRRVTGGVVATAGLATLADGSQVFAKTLEGKGAGTGTGTGTGDGDGETGGGDVFEIEAEGLRALRELGGVATPEVLAVRPGLLVLQPLAPRPDGDARFWERLGHSIATLHATTATGRFGWHQDGWLGRVRQHNAWDTDGHAFYARHRILRWLPEPLVEAAFGKEDRQAVERLCAALPDLIPDMPPVLTHGDLWRENVLSRPGGHPVLVDPAVSYTWAEVDVSMLWCSTRPPASNRFFEAYAEVLPLRDGWRERAPLLNLRELLSTIAHDDDHWGAAQAVRTIIAPFARKR